jgi:hypothetical protein
MSNGSVATASSPEGWTERDWEALLLAIQYKSCTPFIGSGACAGILPLGSTIAEEWAKEYDYPFSDTDNLVRVSQFVAIEGGPRTPRFRILQKFSGKGPPDFSDPTEPHRAVADLELPVYITTNYDDFMMKALQRSSPKRTPQQAMCRWYMARRREPREMLAQVEPTPENPLVFHLHGTLGNPDSMVLTEDDYLDFLMYTAEAPDLIPPRVQQAFAESSLLFIGYRLEDMNFKVLFRKLATYMQRSEGARHVSVQLAPRPNESTEDQIARFTAQKRYLERHYDLQKVKVYWGTARDFAIELQRRRGGGT